MNESELVFTQILQCDRPSLYLNKDRPLSWRHGQRIASVLSRRLSGEPLGYILGESEFMGLTFKVAPGVLIPRPETEILVEAVVKHAAARMPQSADLHILDVGTGSGCIAVSLAKFLPEATLEALDISEQALSIARENAALHKVNINFFQADVFTQYAILATQYDIIVSNPPYIPSARIDYLQPEIQYEPRIALAAGEDGLDYYRLLFGAGCVCLKGNGIIAVEIGYDQKEAVKNIIQKSGKFEIIEIIKDYSAIDRVIVAQRL